MKAIICGAGQVGSNISRVLAQESVDVTVIDQRPDLIQKINESLEVQAMVGYASQPDILEAAGAADADMLIAVTFSDEVNMVACQVAHPCSRCRPRSPACGRAATCSRSGPTYSPAATCR